MGALIDFLLDNFVYVIFVIILLILALIGYIADKTKTNRLRKELTSTSQEDSADIPIASIDSSIKLGDTVNNMSALAAENVNKESTPMPALKADTTKNEATNRTSNFVK